MNGTLIRRVVVVSLFLTVLVAPRASAQAARVFLSGTGTDTGDCSNAAAPCRSLQYAIDQAAAGAEVVIVSSGGYGGATITKSITVNAPTGVIAFVGRTITVTIGSTDTVTLRGLSMNGAVFADSYGIKFTTGGTLNVENTVVTAFVNADIHDVAAGSNLWIHNCDVKKSTEGIYVIGAAAVIENSRAVENTDAGFLAADSANVVVRNSVAANNGTGFLGQESTAGGFTDMVVDSCLATHNGYGLSGITVLDNSHVFLRASFDIVMNNSTLNLNASGGGSSTLVSYGNNRIGGASGGSTGFSSTIAQQ